MKAEGMCRSCPQRKHVRVLRVSLPETPLTVELDDGDIVLQLFGEGTRHWACLLPSTSACARRALACVFSWRHQKTNTGRSGRQNALTRRNMRREGRATARSPVKKPQPDGMSHGGGGGTSPLPMHPWGCPQSPAWESHCPSQCVGVGQGCIGSPPGRPAYAQPLSP